MQINPSEWYSIQQLQKLNVMPANNKSRQKIRGFIETGKLKGFISGDARGRRYLVKGQNVIIFLARFEAGDFHARKGGGKK